MKYDKAFLFLFHNQHTNFYELATISEQNLNPVVLEKFWNFVELANGSCINNIVVVNNEKNEIICCESDKVKKSSNMYTGIVFHVSLPNFVVKINNLLFCNEKKTLFSYSFDKKTLRKIEIGIKVEDIQLSDDQNFIGIKTSTAVNLYNLRFELLFSHDTQAVHFIVSNFPSKTIVAISKEETTVINAQQKPSIQQLETITKTENFDSIDLLYRLNFKEKNFFLYFENQKDSEAVFNHVSQLNSLYSPLSIFNFSDNIINPSSIPENLFELTQLDYFSKVCIVQNSNIIPYTGEKNFYKVLTENNTPDLYQSIFDLINFGPIEKLIIQLKNIKIISVVGNLKTFKLFGRIIDISLSKEAFDGV